MPKYPIDLGKPHPGWTPMPSSPATEEKYYPTLFLDWDESYEFPEEGEMTITFKRKRETNTTDESGTRQSVELEIQSIEEVSAEESEEEKKENEPGSILDRYLKELSE